MQEFFDFLDIFSDISSNIAFLNVIKALVNLVLLSYKQLSYKKKRVCKGWSEGFEEFIDDDNAILCSS